MHNRVILGKYDMENKRLNNINTLVTTFSVVMDAGLTGKSGIFR